MADKFVEVIEVALKSTTDPNIRTLLTTLRDLGATGDLTEDQLAELGGAIEGVSSELQKLDSASGAAAALRKLSTETLAASRAFQESQKQAAALGDQLQKAYAKRKAAAEAAASAEGAAAKASRKELAEAEKEVRKLEASYQKAQNSTRAFAAALDQKTAAAKGTREALRAVGVDTSKLTTEEARLRTEAERATAALRGQVDAVRAQAEAARTLKQRLAEGDEAFRRMTQANKSSVEALSAYRARASEASQATKQLGSETAGATQRFRSLESGLVKIGTLAASVAAGIGAIRFGTEQFSGAADLQQQLAEVQAVSGAAADTVGKLRDAAQAAAEATGIATGEVTKGLGELARAGFDAEAAITALNPTLNLAQAGGIGLSEAVSIATTTLTQFGLGAEQAQRVADVLAQAANASQTSVQGLGLSLSYAAPLARQLGLSLEETTAVIAALGDEGFRGERAGTALRNVFSALLDPTSKFREELNKLGITGNDFGSILQQLAARGDAGKRALLALDSEARPAIAALFLKGGESIRKFTQELQGAEGSAARTAAVIRDTLGNSFQRLGESFDNTFADLIEPVLKPLQGQIESLAASIKTFADSPEFARLQTALSEMFVAGSEAAAEYIRNVDWNKLAADISNFTATTTTVLRDFGASAQEFLGAAETAVDALQVAFNALQTGILALATAATKLTQVTAQFAGVADSIDRAVNPARQLAEALGLYPETAGLAKEAVAGLQGVVDEFATRTVENAQETRDALADIAGGATTAGEEARRAGEVSEGSWARVQEQLAQFEEQQKRVTQNFKDQGEAGKGAAETVKTAEKSAAQELLALQQQRLDLQRKIDAAIAGGASAETLRQLNAQQASNNEQIRELEGLLGRAASASDSVAASARNTGAAFQDVTQRASEAAAAAQQVGEQAGRGAEEGSDKMADFRDLLKALNEEFLATSEAARELFVRNQQLAVGFEAVGKTVTQITQRTLDAAQATREAIAGQKAALDGIVGAYDRAAAAGESAGIEWAQASSLGEEGLRALADRARDGVSEMNLLNQADLDRLAAAADHAADRVAQIQREAEAAKQELEDLAGSLQDELDRRAGNESAILRRQFEEQVSRIDELASRGGDAARQRALEARALADRNFQEEMARIEAETKAREDAARRQADTRIAEADRESSEINRRRSEGDGTTAAARDGKPIEVNINVKNQQTGAAQMVELIQLPELRDQIAGVVMDAIRTGRGVS